MRRRSAQVCKMAISTSKRRGGRKKDRDSEEAYKLTKLEKAVLDHLRLQLPAKKATTVDGDKVEYFTAAKAIDFLLDSKWATGKKGVELLFTTRQSVVKYMQGLMNKQKFYRALKIVLETKDKDKEKEGSSKKSSEKDETEESKAEKKKAKKEVPIKKKPEEGGKKLKQVKRKIKLTFHEEQVFVDGSDAYIWLHEATSTWNMVLGLGLVVGAIAVCLFPLWPHWMRVGTWYVSVVAAILAGAFLFLSLFRGVLFGFIWTITFGSYHFWLLPNLNDEKLGVKDSFKPLFSLDKPSGKGQSDTPSKEDEKAVDEQPEQEGNDEETEENKATEDTNVGKEEESEDDEDEDDEQDSNGNSNGEFEIIGEEEISSSQN